MATRRFSAPTKLEIARKWLRDHMQPEEAYGAGELQRQAIEAGIARRTLQLAATYEVDVKATWNGRGVEKWEWKLK